MHFTIVTETWLTRKQDCPRIIDDLTVGEEISFIRKDRKTRGGGVAICFNPNRIRLTRFPVEQRNIKEVELVCATGNCSLTKRKIAIASIYLPPSISTKELENAIQMLIDDIDKIKTRFPDSLIFIGRDFNKKDLGLVRAAFPDLKPVEAGATRGNYAFDEVYTNVNDRIVNRAIIKPLVSNAGIESDLKIIAAACKLPKHPKVTTDTFKFRPLTKKGTEEFKTRLLSFDWTSIEKETSTESAEALTDALDSMIVGCFPERARKIKSTDAPWFNGKVKKLSLRKTRI